MNANIKIASYFDRDQFHGLFIDTINKLRKYWPKAWRKSGAKTWDADAKARSLVYASAGAEFVLEADLWEAFDRPMSKGPNKGRTPRECYARPIHWLWPTLQGELRTLGREERNGGLWGQKDGCNRSPASWEDSLPASTELPKADTFTPDAKQPRYGGAYWSQRCAQLSTRWCPYGERFIVSERHRAGGDAIKRHWSSSLKYPWSEYARAKYPALADRSPGGNFTYDERNAAPGVVTDWPRAQIERVTGEWRPHSDARWPAWEKDAHAGVGIVWRCYRTHADVAVQWRTTRGGTRAVQDPSPHATRSLDGMRYPWREPYTGRGLGPVKWELARQRGLWADGKSSRPIRWVRASAMPGLRDETRRARGHRRIRLDDDWDMCAGERARLWTSTWVVGQQACSPDYVPRSGRGATGYCWKD